jgi:hypothetical protein
MQNTKMYFYFVLFLIFSNNAFAWRIDLPGGGEWKGDDPDVVVQSAVEKIRDDPTKLIVNPMGYINTTGIPTQGDIFEFVIKNPDKTIELIQNPGQWPYLPVAAGIIASRNAVIAGGAKPIPQHVRQNLRRWYSDELINSVRWTSNWSPIQNSLQAAQMSFNSNTLAIAVINAVVFRNDTLANDYVLWAHELYHIQQYRDWGVFGFAKNWVDNSSVTGPVEAPAYQRENEARNIFGTTEIDRQVSYPTPTPAPPPSIPVRFCTTNIGTCALPPAMLPLGTPCYCNAANGQRINGSAF